MNTTPGSSIVLGESVVTPQQLAEFEQWAEPYRRQVASMRVGSLLPAAVAFVICASFSTLLVYPIALLATWLLEFPFHDPMFVGMMGCLIGYLVTPWLLGRRR